MSRSFARRLHPLSIAGFGGFPEMTSLHKPVICAVNCMAVGAGFELLLRADFVAAAEHAQLMLREVRIGMAPNVGTFMLARSGVFRTSSNAPRVDMHRAARSLRLLTALARSEGPVTK